ncbi:MAG: YbbR-like domain-containing protein [Nitrospirae bacterium]|nr:YbbR-like domain-containing protein [Nitrospirota bacterium]
MKRFFTENIDIKIITLILAIILWFFVNIKGHSDIMLELPIEYKNIPKDYEITKTSANLINVRIQGQEHIIKGLSPRDLSIYIDLSKAHEGEKIYYVTKDNIKLPPSISVVNIDPSSITVNLEEVSRRTLNVKPKIRGTPKKGYSIVDVISIPGEITVEGSKKELDKLNHIDTEPIDVRNADSTFEREVRLVYKERDINNRRETVRVKIIISGEGK